MANEKLDRSDTTIYDNDDLVNIISEKDAEILQLRLLVQDLYSERNDLENNIKQLTKNNNFISITPKRRMDYNVDLTQFIDDYDDIDDDILTELSDDDDDAENGMLLFDEIYDIDSDDGYDINPQVASKLKEALEAVQKVTLFTNDRDIEAKKFEEIINIHKEEYNEKIDEKCLSESESDKDSNSDDIVLILDEPMIDPHKKRKDSIKAFEIAFEKERYKRRRSSLPNKQRDDIPIGLIPPVIDNVDIETKSAPLPILPLLKSLNVNKEKANQNPANTPKLGTISVNNSNNDDIDDVNEEDLGDIVVDGDLFKVYNQNQSMLDVENKFEDNNKSSSLSLIDRLRETINDKIAVIADLQNQIKILRNNRSNELLLFQSKLQEMKEKCHNWYQRLITKIIDMENEYLMNSQNRDQEYNENLKKISILNKELDQFKNRYFTLNEKWNNLLIEINKLKQEKESLSNEYEKGFIEFEQLANKKVNELETTFNQQINRKHQNEISLNKQIEILTEENNKLKHENDKINIELEQKCISQQKKLEIEKFKKEKYFNEQINNLKQEKQYNLKQIDLYIKQKENIELKLNASKTSLLELAQNIKDINDDNKIQKTKYKKLLNKKNKLKETIKILNEQLQKYENIKIVNKEFIAIKNQFKLQKNAWNEEKLQNQKENEKLLNKINQITEDKIKSIIKYDEEMNNLREFIKKLQKTIQLLQNKTKYDTNSWWITK